MNSHILRLLALPICLAATMANAAVSNGHLTLSAKEVAQGNAFDLTGEWLYKPGYEIGWNEIPQTSFDTRGYRGVSVPQFLSRIHWWLDDSEDFKKAETARLKKLGFDTDRAEDGWYHLDLNLPKLPAGQHVSIEFDGVAMKCDAYCNGVRLGSHAGMFSRFSFDLTPHLKEGQNALAVFVSMEKIPASSLSQGTAVTVNLTASKVMTMSKGMFGPMSPGYDNRAYDLHGIWQPVRLVIRGEAKLNDVWFIPSTNGAVVKVEASSLGKLEAATLNAQWVDKKTGKTFANAGPVRMQLLATNNTQELSITNVQPKLWTPADPNLYSLQVTLSTSDGTVLDSWQHDVGFRTFEVRGNKLFLNGHPWWLRGANHLPYGKNPWDPQLARKLIQQLHDANLRITRTHATPWNEAWLDAADEIGLGVSVEGIRPWALAGKIGATPTDMFQHWLMENEDVVRRCRNHPSVLIYTVGNEMMLRDNKNPEKWQQLSDVVKQTRKVDPTRPVICSSEYQREEDVYDEVIKAKGLDDGDMDDAHRYFGWYRESAFALESPFEKDFDNQRGRPLIGQEISTGYPDLDSGLPVLRYTRDLLTPQAWIGHYAYPKNDPAIFLQHDAVLTKRLAEQIRFQRADKTAGFMMFAAECWFRHSYEPKGLKPYPVIAAMKEAFAPIGIAFETRRRHFFPAEKIETALFITNDDDQFRDVSDATLSIEISDAKSGATLSRVPCDKINVNYYETRRVPVTFSIPDVKRERRQLKMVARLASGKQEIGRTTETIDVIATPQESTINSSVTFTGASKAIESFAVSHLDLNSSATNHVIVLSGASKSDELAEGGKARAAVEAGATAIWLSPGSKARSIFPNEIIDVKETHGEYADWWPSTGTTIADKLQPMDIKWWGRTNDGRTFVVSSSHRLNPKGHGRELIRFIPAHGYISEEKVPEQYRTVLCEIPVGKGRVWICDLDLESCVSVDPLAQRVAFNLLRAAADPLSTAKLPKLPSHEELLKTQ